VLYIVLSTNFNFVLCPYASLLLSHSRLCQMGRWVTTRRACMRSLVPRLFQISFSLATCLLDSQSSYSLTSIYSFSSLTFNMSTSQSPVPQSIPNPLLPYASFSRTKCSPCSRFVSIFLLVAVDDASCTLRCGSRFPLYVCLESARFPCWLPCG
jgi:hypothetical protein